VCAEEGEGDEEGECHDGSLGARGGGHCGWMMLSRGEGKKGTEDERGWKGRKLTTMNDAVVVGDLSHGRAALHGLGRRQADSGCGRQGLMGRWGRDGKLWRTGMLGNTYEIS